MAYTMTMAMGVIVDESNNKFAGLSGAAYRFTVKDTTPPSVTKFDPQPNATRVPTTATIVLTFNEDVQAGHGSFLIKNGNDVINVSVANVSQVTYLGKTVSIRPPTALVEGFTYGVMMASGVIVDKHGNPSPAIAESVYQFTIVPPPLRVVTYAPAQGANGVLFSANVVLRFNDEVRAGNGTIQFAPSTANAVATHIEAGDTTQVATTIEAEYYT